jgi:hypothetical protein
VLIFQEFEFLENLVDIESIDLESIWISVSKILEIYSPHPLC